MIYIVVAIEFFMQFAITLLVILELKKKKTFSKKNFILNYLTYLYLSHMVLIIVLAILIPVML
jgi:hypothetical protein